jgi:hypothetical protein
MQFIHQERIVYRQQKLYVSQMSLAAESVLAAGDALGVAFVRGHAQSGVVETVQKGTVYLVESERVRYFLHGERKDFAGGVETEHDSVQAFC